MVYIECRITILEQYLSGITGSLILLLYTIKGTVIAGANASRWIQVPLLGYRSRRRHWHRLCYSYLLRDISKTREEPLTFKSHYGSLAACICYLIPFYHNLYYSINFAMILMLVFIGKYPLKYIGYCRF
jgi:cell division protein FtsW